MVILKKCCLQPSLTLTWGYGTLSMCLTHVRPQFHMNSKNKKAQEQNKRFMTPSLILEVERKEGRMERDKKGSRGTGRIVGVLSFLWSRKRLDRLCASNSVVSDHSASSSSLTLEEQYQWYLPPSKEGSVSHSQYAHEIL